MSQYQKDKPFQILLKQNYLNTTKTHITVPVLAKTLLIWFYAKQQLSTTIPLNVPNNVKSLKHLAMFGVRKLEFLVLTKICDYNQVLQHRGQIQQTDRKPVTASAILTHNKKHRQFHCC